MDIYDESFRTAPRPDDSAAASRRTAGPDDPDDRWRDDHWRSGQRDDPRDSQRWTDQRDDQRWTSQRDDDWQTGKRDERRAGHAWDDGARDSSARDSSARYEDSRDDAARGGSTRYEDSRFDDDRDDQWRDDRWRDSRRARQRTPQRPAPHWGGWAEPGQPGSQETASRETTSRESASRESTSREITALAERTDDLPIYQPDTRSAPATETSYDLGRAGSREGAEGSSTNGRVFFVVFFWFALAASVELWWLDTPGGTINSVSTVFLAGGRIIGMVAGFILLTEILLMSRVGWLERWMGSHDLLIWHRELGGFLVIAVLAHIAFIVIGYSGITHASVLSTSWTMLTTFQDMISATIGTALLIGIGLLAIRSVRRIMPYELWYYLHQTSYLVLLLGYGHQFADGQELLRAGFGHWYWTTLYLFVLACLIWGRLVAPVVLNARHRLRVIEVDPEAPDMVSIYIAGRNLDRLPARAGQYFRWRFLTRGGWWQAHPFSLSAAPNVDWLRLTVKIVGNHTADLRQLRPGARVFAEGPSGVFTADRSVHPRALLIAGGSGIAPIRALLEDLPGDTVVIYRASKESDLVFRAELDWLARERGARVWYVLGARDDPLPRRALSPRGLREIVPDVRHRDVFLCGPKGLVESSVKSLRRLRIPRKQIHLDPFEF